MTWEGSLEWFLSTSVFCVTPSLAQSLGAVPPPACPPALVVLPPGVQAWAPVA